MENFSACFGDVVDPRRDKLSRHFRWADGVSYWHIADARRRPGLGPLTGALPTIEDNP